MPPQRKQTRTGKTTELRKHLANVLGPSPKEVHQMAVLEAMKRAAFAKFAARHIVDAIKGKGKTNIDFGRIHAGLGHLLDAQSPLAQAEKERLKDAMVSHYKKHPYAHWVQRATLIHAMAGAGLHNTRKGRRFFQKIAEDPSEHYIVQGTAKKYL